MVQNKKFGVRVSNFKMTIAESIVLGKELLQLHLKHIAQAVVVKIIDTLKNMEQLALLGNTKIISQLG